jgi:hypothetical protein
MFKYLNDIGLFSKYYVVPLPFNVYTAPVSDSIQTCQLFVTAGCSGLTYDA